MGKFKEETLDSWYNLHVDIKKLHPDAVIPSYSKDGDAGLDFTAIADGKIESDKNGIIVTYRTGIALAIPKGYVGLVFPRSSIYKKGLSLTNSVGVVDSGYRGEILFKFRVNSHYGSMYKKGERIGQLIILPYPKVEFNECDELDTTDRGDGGFGHTGA